MAFNEVKKCFYNDVFASLLSDFYLGYSNFQPIKKMSYG